MSEVAPRGQASVPPSGRQLTISSGAQRAVIVEVGGGIRLYEVAGVDVLDGYGLDERCAAARGQPLIPWPNRLHRGRYEWERQQLQTPINEVNGLNALHGYTLGHNWTVVAHGQNEAVASLRLHPQEGYPFALDLSVTYSLAPAGLTVTNTARNVGATACPYAHGAHPYVTVGTAQIDESSLIVPAATYFPTDMAQIPVGRAAVKDTKYDFREGHAVGRVRIDHAFTDLTRDDDGLARVVLSSPVHDRSVAVWLDRSYPYVMIFTGDTVEPISRRRQGLGVEPMTCPPNGFASGEGVLRLEPGAAVTTRWGITPWPSD